MLDFSASWTALAIDELRTLWAAGLTGSEISDAIATKFCIRFSRSAVIGKAHRLGLASRRGLHCADHVASAAKIKGWRRPPPSRPKAKPEVQAKPKKKIRYSTLSLAPVGSPGVPAVFRDTTEEMTVVRHKSIMQLSNTDCRWLFGDPCSADHFYCGAPGADMSECRPYCEWHTMRACANSFADDALEAA